VSKDLLGMEYGKDLNYSFIEMGHSLIDMGIIVDKRKEK
jgi:hypothetical protein